MKFLSIRNAIWRPDHAVSAEIDKLLAHQQHFDGDRKFVAYSEALPG